MSTVSSSSSEHGYFSSSSEDTEPIQQIEHHDSFKPKLNLKQLKAHKKRKEEAEISRIIARIQDEHISTISEPQYTKNQFYCTVLDNSQLTVTITKMTEVEKGLASHSSNTHIHPI